MILATVRHSPAMMRVVDGCDAEYLACVDDVAPIPPAEIGDRLARAQPFSQGRRQTLIP